LSWILQQIHLPNVLKGSSWNSILSEHTHQWKD
jgi:hypothetical protein